jgi:hypothetical protein
MPISCRTSMAGFLITPYRNDRASRTNSSDASRNLSRARARRSYRGQHAQHPEFAFAPTLPHDWFFQPISPGPDSSSGPNRADALIPLVIFILFMLSSKTGFLDLKPRIDRYEGRSRVSWIILFLPIKIISLLFWLREKNKFRTITPENRALVAAFNSRDPLLGRTLILCAHKPM